MMVFDIRSTQHCLPPAVKLTVISAVQINFLNGLAINLTILQLFHRFFLSEINKSIQIPGLNGSEHLI